MKQVIYLIMVAALVCGCCKEKEKEKESGSNYGVITDKATGEPVGDANVQLRPGGSTTLTGNDGRYEFLEVERGTYRINVTKTNYTNLIDDYDIIVEPNKRTKRDVQIEKLPMALRVVNDRRQDLDILAFGSEASLVSRSFNIFNDGFESLEWEITENCEWISELSETNGWLYPGEQQAIVITIDRKKLGAGNNVYVLNISSDKGSKELTITATGLTQTTGLFVTTFSVTANTYGYSLKGRVSFNDVNIRPTEVGFYYSTSNKPNEDEFKIVLDAELLYEMYYYDGYFDFSKGLYFFDDNLENNAYYYVQAYAKNRYGTVYGDIVRFLCNYY
jgi:hypothetical protein